MRPLNALIGCECSGRERDAWRNAGHNAWSIDLLGPDSEPPGFTRAEWVATWRAQTWANYHLEGDIRDWLARGPDGTWDIVIAHTPCTYLCNSGERWLYSGPTRAATAIAAPIDRERWKQMRLGALLFADVWRAPHIGKKVLENPIMHRYAKHAINAYIRKPYLPKPQIVHPWMFGDAESKATCLGLKA